MKTEQQIIQEQAGELANKFPILIIELSYLAYEQQHANGQEEVMYQFETLMNTVFSAIRQDLGGKA